MYDDRPKIWGGCSLRFASRARVLVQVQAQVPPGARVHVLGCQELLPWLLRQAWLPRRYQRLSCLCSLSADYRPRSSCQRPCTRGAGGKFEALIGQAHEETGGGRGGGPGVTGSPALLTKCRDTSLKRSLKYPGTLGSGGEKTDNDQSISFHVSIQISRRSRQGPSLPIPSLHWHH